MTVLDTAIGANKCLLDDLLCFGWMEEHAERDWMRIPFIGPY
jgi:hypothetical protein